MKKYKCINLDMTNQYGIKYDLNTWYINDNPIFYFATNFEDCFRFYDSDDSYLCEIEVDGIVTTFDDEYNGNYDLGKASKFKINKVLNREEIIDLAINLQFNRKKNFIKTFHLHEEELDYFYSTLKYNSEIINFDYKYSKKK